MDEFDRRIARDIEETGWHVIKVPEDAEGPGYAFTIGLWRSFQHPELMIFGLPLDVCHVILNVAGREVKGGAVLRAGETTDALLDGHLCALRDVPASRHRELLGAAVGFYAPEPFPALQVVWPDRDGRFPSEPECAPDVREDQPILGP